VARNIEIKARVLKLDELEALVRPLATQGPIPIAQDDTFFNCSNGRLKLRQFNSGSGELIFYERADSAGPKTSHYVLSPTAEPASLREALHLAHGTIGRVVKQRTLYLVGRTRVHLDRVENLGDFMELEVVLHADEAAESGIQEAQGLMKQLKVSESDLIEGAYFDLLKASAA
jgi:predicted adenylyl cyclase CyaB